MTDPKVPEKKAIQPVKDELVKPEEDVLKKIQDVLKQYGGNESDIPLNHEYWNLQAQHRAIQQAKRDQLPVGGKDAPSSDRDSKNRT